VSGSTAAAELLAALRAALATVGVRWYIFGAQAVSIWGRPRMSADLDVTIEMAPFEVAQLLPIFTHHGFRARVEDIPEFVGRTRVLPLVHETTGIPLDLVFAGPGLEAEFLDRACPVSIEGHEVPVISPEDLVVSKILAGRSKDIEDIQYVLDSRLSELNQDRLWCLLEMPEAVSNHY